MSQNYELLTEIERESAAADESPLSAACVIAKPIMLPGLIYTGQDEMLRLIQQVFFSADVNAPRQVVFCGVDEENDSGAVCASAARTLAAHTTRSVCLLDANVRLPHLSGLLGANAAATLLTRPASPHKLCTQIASNLWLANPSMLTDDRDALVTAEELKQHLALLRIEFDYVLIDAPAVGACADAVQLGRFADAVILVIEANRTRRLTARKAKESLEAAGVRLLGTVLHNRTFPIPKRLYKRL